MTNQEEDDFAENNENYEDNENSGSNALIFEDPMDNPGEKVIRFCRSWQWREAKAQLWKMYRAACCSLDFETSQEREMLISFMEELTELMKAAFALDNLWNESAKALHE